MKFRAAISRSVVQFEEFSTFRTSVSIETGKRAKDRNSREQKCLNPSISAAYRHRLMTSWVRQRVTFARSLSWICHDGSWLNSRYYNISTRFSVLRYSYLMVRLTGSTGGFTGARCKLPSYPGGKMVRMIRSTLSSSRLRRLIVPGWKEGMKGWKRQHSRTEVLLWVSAVMFRLVGEMTRGG